MTIQKSSFDKIRESDLKGSCFQLNLRLQQLFGLINAVQAEIPPSSGDALVGAWGSRGSQTVTSVGQIFAASDQPLIYVANSRKALVYQSGVYVSTQANKPSPGGDDAGMLWFVTDYNHLLRWSGSAWGWGPGDAGSGEIRFWFSVTPTTGWHLCDGSVVTYLQSDGTTTTATLPNFNGLPAYLKMGDSPSYTSANAPTVSTAPALTSNSGLSVNAVVTISANAEPLHYGLAAYFRL